MYEKVYELPWEVEVFEKLLEEKVYPQIGKGSKVKITGAVSENIKVRQKIKEKIEDRIQMLGAKPEDTSVICAYKQEKYASFGELNYADASRQAVKDMIEDISTALNNR